MVRRIDLSSLLPPTLHRVDPKTKALVEVSRSDIEGKILLLYFGAHWCFPCQSFTERLASLYQVLKTRKGISEDVEVIFVSQDNHSGQYELYFQHQAEEGGTWLAIPFKGCREEREMLTRECRVLSIPTLTVVGPDGTVIAPNAVAALKADSSGSKFPWEGAVSNTASIPIWIAVAFALIIMLLPRLLEYTGFRR